MVKTRSRSKLEEQDVGEPRDKRPDGHSAAERLSIEELQPEGFVRVVDAMSGHVSFRWSIPNYRHSATDPVVRCYELTIVRLRHPPARKVFARFKALPLPMESLLRIESRGRFGFLVQGVGCDRCGSRTQLSQMVSITLPSVTDPEP